MPDLRAVKCPSCGAVPTVAADKQTVVCEYCGTESWVVRREGVLERAVGRPAPAAPGETSQLPVAIETHSRRWTVGTVFVPLLLVLGVGYVVYRSMQLRWLGQTPAWVVDVDGDGTPDVVGFVLTPLDGIAIGALDGLTGDELWVGERLGDHPDDLGGELVLAGGWLFYLLEAEGPRAFRLDDGEERLQLPAMGKIHRVCDHEGVAVDFVLDRSEVQRLTLVDGTMAPAPAGACPVERKLNQDTMYPGPTHTGIERMTTRVDGQIYLHEGAAYAAYDKRGEDAPRLTSFEGGDGPQRWDVSVGRDAPVGGLAAAGETIYVSLWGTLVAFDTGTGNERFRVGN